MDSPWSIDSAVARFGPLANSKLQGRIDLSDAAAGLSNIALGGAALPGAVNSLVDSAAADLRGAQPSDWYLRGADLVAVYERTPRRPIRLQFQWTVVAADDDQGILGGVDWAPSVQTDELDSLPQLTARSSIGAGRTAVHSFDLKQRDAKEGDPTAAAVHVVEHRFPGELGFPGDLVYVEFSHPRFGVDCDASEVAVVHRLFQRRLEKGVILRSRIRGLFLQGADESRLRRLALDFADQPLPLTA